MDSKDFVISLTIVTEQPEKVARAMEVFGRAAVGLSMEDLFVSISVSRTSDEDES